MIAQGSSTPQLNKALGLLLQRQRCACGGVIGLDSTCGQCRQHRLHSASQPLGESSAPPTTDQTGHHFERVRVTPNSTPIRLQRQPATTPANAPATQPIEPPQRPERETLTNVQKGEHGNFDVELDRSGAAAGGPCRLTAEMRVYFHVIDNYGVWPDKRAWQWQQEFARLVEDRWSLRYLLTPVQDCPGEPCKSAAVVLRVVPLPPNPDGSIPAGAHHYIRLFYNKAAGETPDIGLFSKMFESDIRDDSSANSDDLRKRQTPVAHEFGHMLGLGHVRCDDTPITGQNDPDCYGVGNEERADIMGMGEIVTEKDYAPFAEVMSQIAGCEWQTWRPSGPTRLFGSRLRLPLAILGGAIGIAAGILTGGIATALLLGGAGALAGGAFGHALDMP